MITVKKNAIPKCKKNAKSAKFYDLGKIMKLKDEDFAFDHHIIL